MFLLCSCYDSYAFALLGMEFFQDVRDEEGNDDQRYSFETFGCSVLVLFQLSTSNNWNDIM